VSFGGALIGSMILYTIPAAMNIMNLKAEQKSQARNPSSAPRRLIPLGLEIAFNYGLGVMGIICAVIGVYMSLKN
jgi:hypothetical protein